MKVNVSYFMTLKVNVKASLNTIKADFRHMRAIYKPSWNTNLISKSKNLMLRLKINL